jgi:hypothetical protein
MNCFSKASGIDRKDLIQYKEKNSNNRSEMSEFYSGVNIVAMVKEAMEVFFRIGPLHVNVVYETRPGKWLLGLLTLILKHNNFTFNEEHIIQINRATMGTTMAPSYANFFMGKLEKQIIQSSPQKPFSWSRFIDDIDMKCLLKQWLMLALL